MKNKILAFNLNNPLLSGSFLMVGGTFAINIINYLYHLIMGRLLGPSEYGVLASLFSILYIISVVPASASISIVKFISEAKTESEIAKVYKTIKRFVVRFAFVSSIAFFLIGPFVAKFLHIDNVINVLIIAPVVFLSLVSLMFQSTLQGRLRFWGVVGPNLTSSVFKFVLGILFVMLGLKALGAMLGILIASGLAALYGYYLIKGFEVVYVKKLDFDLKPFFKYSLPVLLHSLSFTFIFTFDVILAKHYLSAQDAGIYAALSTLGKIIYFASGPVASVMFPIVSGKKARQEDYGKVFCLSLFVTLLISFSALFFYYLFPEFSIRMLYGESYLLASDYLFKMGLYMSFYTYAYFFVNFMLSINKTNTVVFPILGVLIQVWYIFINHTSISDIINASLFASIFILLGSILYAQLLVSGVKNYVK